MNMSLDTWKRQDVHIRGDGTEQEAYHGCDNEATVRPGTYATCKPHAEACPSVTLGRSFA
jgi:hypothetical protein